MQANLYDLFITRSVATPELGPYRCFYRLHWPLSIKANLYILETFPCRAEGKGTLIDSDPLNGVPSLC